MSSVFILPLWKGIRVLQAQVVAPGTIVISQILVPKGVFDILIVILRVSHLYAPVPVVLVIVLVPKKSVAQYHFTVGYKIWFISVQCIIVNSQP
jgi:hypothetical protein